MKVLLISDFGIHHSLGGAQRSNQIIIDKGKSRGHEIEVYHYDSDASVLFKEYDVVISSNLEVLSKHPGIIQYIINCKNHVRLEHDFCRYLDNETRKFLYKSCKKTFFLTMYHYSKFVDYYGDYFINCEIVPDPIDVLNFRALEDLGYSRKNDILYVGFMHPLKGTGNFIDYVNKNPDKKCVVAGWGGIEYENFMHEKENINFLGKVAYEKMPSLYNSYKLMYYNPEFDEPFCRSVGEALCCGMKIIGNSNKIGSLHMYNEDPGMFRTRCAEAEENFWEKIECL